MRFGWLPGTRSGIEPDRLDLLRWSITVLPACAVVVVEVLYHQVVGEAGAGATGVAIACGLALVVSYPLVKLAFGVLDRARSRTLARAREVEALDALVRERERLSRELHDGTAQLLAYLLFRTETVGQLVAADRRAEALAELEGLREAADSLYVDVRESISGLRTRVVERGLAAALQDYAAEFGEHHAIDVAVDIDQTLPPSPVVAFHLFRVAQEALANVRKHAEARRAWLEVRRAPPAAVRLVVRDDGRGFDTAGAAVPVGRRGRRRFGLEMMRERAEALGGTLVVESQPGHGTRVLVTVPLVRPA